MAETPHTFNSLLASLHADKMAALLPHLRFVEMPQETVLYENGDTIKAVYFPHGGLVSLVVDLASGETIEAAMIGRDSVTGTSSAFDNKISLNRAVCRLRARLPRWISATSATSRRKIAPFGPRSPATNNLSWHKRSKPQPATPPMRSKRGSRAGSCAAGICWATMKSS